MFNQNYYNSSMFSRDNMENSPNAGYFNKQGANPYIRGGTTYMPQPMEGDMSEDALYPLESSLATPQFNSPTPQANFGYDKGGLEQGGGASLPSLAETIRQQGNEEDTILAHINPLEAMMLKQMGGSGTINPRTGLPQFGFFSNPGKWLKSVIGPAGGAILGNMILPGIGGVLGGALGGMGGSAVRGRKDFLQSGLRGGLMGAALPTAAGMLGSGANALGMTGTGSALSNYGAQNAILPSLGIGAAAGASAGAGTTANASPLAAALAPTKEVVLPATEQGFLSKLMGNSTNFLSQPANLLALASAAGSFAGRPKEKTPEKRAQEEKRYAKAMQLSAEERAAMEAEMLANRQMERRLARNQYLPEERFAVKPIYRRSHNPEEYRRTGNWLSYYDNPEFGGAAIGMEEGGLVPEKGKLPSKVKPISSYLRR